MFLSVELSDVEAAAFARVIRQVQPEYYGVDSAPWYRALDAISPHLPPLARPSDDTHTAPTHTDTNTPPDKGPRT